MKQEYAGIIILFSLFFAGFFFGMFVMYQHEHEEVLFLTSFTQDQQERIYGFEQQYKTCMWELEKKESVIIPVTDIILVK